MNTINSLVVQQPRSLSGSYTSANQAYRLSAPKAYQNKYDNVIDIEDFEEVSEENSREIATYSGQTQISSQNPYQNMLKAHDGFKGQVVSYKL